MLYKLLQLNIFQGKFLPRIIDFVKHNDIDILQFQEVTGGSLSRGGVSKYPNETHNGTELTPTLETKGIDCFKLLIQKLGYMGDMTVTMAEITDPKSYHGIATFIKPSFMIEKKEDIWLHQRIDIEPDFTEWSQVGRAALVLKLNKDGQNFYSVNTHLAWGPNPLDDEYKIKQAEILCSYLEKLKLPFLLSGDFNVLANTKTAHMFTKLAANQTEKNNIVNTLNPRVHSVKKLFPDGLAVDFVFVTEQLKVKSTRLVDAPDLSDHFGILIEFEI